MNRNEINREKQRLFVELQEELFRRIRRLQNGLYRSVLDLLDKLNITQEGQLTRSVANVRRVNDVQLVIEQFQNTKLGELAIWLRRQISKFFNLNRQYFGTMVQVGQTASKVENLVLAELGFSANGKLIKNGWLYTVTQNTGVGQVVAQQVNRAIAAKVGLTEFKKQFKEAFTGADGLGVLERHFHTHAFDLFQEVDRKTAKNYADEFGMNNAVYSGTIKDNTRPFCKARVQKVYSREEIEKWKDLDFQGKPKGFYDPFTQCGGYNCRHHLAWISDELAEQLRN